MALLLHHAPTAPPRTAGAALAATFAAILQHHAAVSATLREVKTSTPGRGLHSLTSQLNLSRV
jgi:hypothetical protein